jgi:hypothetical protein
MSTTKVGYKKLEKRQGLEIRVSGATVDLDHRRLDAS